MAITPEPIQPGTPKILSTPPNKRGGARSGAGRKPNAVGPYNLAADRSAAVRQARNIAIRTEFNQKQSIEDAPFSSAVHEARLRIRDSYSEILDALFTLNAGGKQVTRRRELAGLILVDAYSEPDSNGKQMKIKQQLFPDIKPGKMVMVWEQEICYPPDSTSAQFLFNRLAGKPSEEKISPMDEAQVGVSLAMPTREEVLKDVMELLYQKYEQRATPTHIPDITLAAKPQPAKAKAAKAQPVKANRQK